jgi:hypothetical protein
MSIEFLLKKNNCFAQREELLERKDEGAPILLRSLTTRCQTIGDTIHYQNDEFLSKACPCKNLHPLASTLVKMANALQAGILPYEGGLLDQPVILMEMIEIAQRCLRDYEDKMMKENQKKSGAKR